MIADNIIRALMKNGFTPSGRSQEEFFLVRSMPLNVSVNHVRINNVDRVYAGEETISFYSGGRDVAVVFYHSITAFNVGGYQRV